MPDARDSHVTVYFVASQRALRTLLSEARTARYLTAASGDLDRATDLYLWATELSGSLHAQISFVELAVRNAIDPQLASWNAQQHGGSALWTAHNATQQPLYNILAKDIREARRRAEKEANLRADDHHRSGDIVNHDDIVAQLMFGTWVKVLRPVTEQEAAEPQKLLWQQAVQQAFPHATQADSGRVQIGNQLDALRRLRNRVAHHDNLLEVNVHGRLNGMLSVLAKIDPDYPSLALARSSLRRILKEDPRRAW
jgi:hypothetical protein